MAKEVDRVNRLAWGSRSVEQIFVRRDGHIDAIETQMMRRAAGEARDQPILDIGVGGGRTTAFLRSVSHDYVGIDYLENLVQAARLRHPGIQFEHMDARDLSAFDDDTFGLAVFSLNGIDGASHAGRRAILAEVNRVLRPGGAFVYSTMNLDYRRGGHRAAWADWRLAVRRPMRGLRYAVRLPALSLRRRRLARATERGPDWDTVATLAYGAPVIWHRITLSGALRELGEAGFDAVEVFGPGGVVYADPSGVDTSEWSCLYLLARKR